MFSGAEAPTEEPAADVFTAIHSRAAESSSPTRLRIEPLQLSSSLEGWPERPSALLPLFRVDSPTTGSQPSGHSFQWLQNLSGCPKSKDSMFVVHKPRHPGRLGLALGSAAPPQWKPSAGLGPGPEDVPPPLRCS